MRRGWRLLALVMGLALGSTLPVRAQDDGIARPGPPALEDFETDADRDGIPDGWYNLRDAKLVTGGVVRPHCLRFENERPGRQARISRAFGVNGKAYEALIIGVWVRVKGIEPGERKGDEPGLAIDFLGPQLRTLGRGMLGPWKHNLGQGWVHVAKRIAVPPDSLDAIMSVGLLGATGVMEIDGLTFELVERGGKPTTNLLVGGDFELGDPEPFGWIISNGARRSYPGHHSSAALELTPSGSKALNGLAVTVERLQEIDVSLSARGSGLRGAGGAAAAFFFLDGDGKFLPGSEKGIPVFRWEGSFDWQARRTSVPVPAAAIRAVLQFEKDDALGSLWIDDVKVTASPKSDAGAWTPYHVETSTADWKPVLPSEKIEARSALDASFLLQAPAGKHGFVQVRDGRLAFEKGGRARFFGVVLLAPAAFQEPERSDALADRLARSGINLVRLGELDTPLGPGRSLIDDARDDTKALDALALAKLDHFIAALKSRGIYIALELQGARRFRAGDDVEGYRGLPEGGGPAAAFDPTIRARVLETAEALLTHVNPETGLALRDDPVLAWVTLAGELTLFDLIEHPNLLSPESAKRLKELAQKHGGAARKFWQTTESAQWKELAEGLRDMNLRVPIAGCSHFRRTPTEFVAAQSAPGLDLIDDRLYWNPLFTALPDRQSIVRDLSGGLVALAAKKRHSGHPYVAGQWCDYTHSWALPYEAADLMLAAQTAVSEDWDALVRRGVFLFPEVWGANATGTGGGDDFFRIPEVVNGIPQVFAMLPHAASVALQGPLKTQRTQAPGRAATVRRGGVPGWDPQLGRLVIDTPHTQVLAGWPAGQRANFEALEIDIDSTYAVVAATSLSSEPIASTRRLLVSAVARVEPTGLRMVDEWRQEVADAGRAPLLQEPVRAKVVWHRKGTIKAYALDNTGARTAPVALEKTALGVRLAIAGESSTLHWELVAE